MIAKNKQFGSKFLRKEVIGELTKTTYEKQGRTSATITLTTTSS